ncbi:MAG: helix-turn-helix domain-containing protein [Gammaproteobacteria bacterium]
MPRQTTSIAERLKQARELAQMEPAELRKELRKRGIDLSKTGLHRIETAEPKNPNLKLIQTIAKITDVSPAWILFGEGPSVPENQLGRAVRMRVLDTIELMSAALELTKAQENALKKWLKSVRLTKPKRH